MLKAIDFHGGPGTAELMAGVEILKELNRSGGRKVPTHADLVRSRPVRRLHRQGPQGRRQHGIPALLGAVRDLGVAGRAAIGDIFVPGSRRYADPATYLYTLAQWTPRQAAFWRLVGKPADPGEAIAQGKDELHQALGELEQTLAGSLPDESGAVRLDDDDNLVIPKLSAEDVPAEAEALREELAGMLPFAPIASLLIELDVRTSFLDCFTHASGCRQTKSTEVKRNILAVLIAMATNLGLARMSEACGVPYAVLAWTAEWYVREETLREANTVIVNHHHGLAMVTWTLLVPHAPPGEGFSQFSCRADLVPGGVDAGTQAASGQWEGARRTARRGG
ncbi:Tn3 family transposase [Nonomuraea sp. NPDC050394]|uniref:Tn3 family transposase n=1 Tax=Nonomuraea sp. NPDC050394 TaxID=3364363 RepID=UPI00379E204B